MDTNKLLMHWKGPYEIISRCGKGNDYWVEVNKKVKTFHANMLKKYIKRADQDGPLHQNLDENQVKSCDVCVAITGRNKYQSVNDNEMMELANCHQKETVQDVKLGIELTKTQRKEMMNTVPKTQRSFFGYPR